MQEKPSSKTFSPVRGSDRRRIHMTRLIEDHVPHNLFPGLHHDKSAWEPFGIIQDDFFRITALGKSLSLDLKNLLEILDQEGSDGVGRTFSQLLTVLGIHVCYGLKCSMTNVHCSMTPTLLLWSCSCRS